MGHFSTILLLSEKESLRVNVKRPKHAGKRQASVAGVFTFRPNRRVYFARDIIGYYHERHAKSRKFQFIARFRS